MSEPDWVIESKLARKAGQLEEQERIIKLLEKELVFHEPVVINRHKLIALIKGEK